MRMKYTTLGDPVNTAARLESLDKQSFVAGSGQTDCRILITESTRELLDQRFQLGSFGTIELRGKAEPVQVYSVEGHADTTVVALHDRGVM